MFPTIYISVESKAPLEISLDCFIGRGISWFGTRVTVKSEISFYVIAQNGFIHAVHFLEETGDVSLENVKECEFLRNFPKLRPKQSSVLSPSVSRMEETLRWATVG